jgi:hypothetical protein
LTAFPEPILGSGFVLDEKARFFANPAFANGSESGGGHSPPGSSSLPDPAIQQNQHSRDIREERYGSIDSTKKKDASISDRIDLV